MKPGTHSILHLARREFHVSRRARERYEMPETLFSEAGNVVFADFHAARTFAHRMNQRRDLLRHPERAVAASQIHALGLIDEVLHLVVARYCRERAPSLLADALARLESGLGREKVDLLLTAFVDEFPPTAVFRGDLTAAEYLEGATGAETHREAALEELLLLWTANRNPAFAPFIELFDESGLCRGTDYRQAMEQLEAYLGQTSGGDGAAGESLLSMLFAPMRAAPNSLQGQLEFIRATWTDLLGPDLYRVLGGLDFLSEEQRVFFPAGPGPVEAPDYAEVGEAEENYSPDREWMPRLVLLAKNAYVWLAQLSHKHGREITTLDAVPDSELEVLAGWGITGLWLIGVWERSRASERIKKMMGDEEAVASAYSLEDYRIAGDLGGEAAYEDFRERAWRYGIRLSTDMVPNHMGIDSRWVIEHPDWFIGCDTSPFPAYTFDGPDLSDDERVGVYIEDHYWQRSDAAVVFKRVDHATGSERYIYHGNDGTSMPWNDTAQLDYRNSEVREAVIQTILAVARRSPVIRFDAAMTLAREHYHRLWFPEPGSGGDIPSRAEFGMTRADFEAVMPEEFWREVVDRVAAEAPDTLLLAEAFWLLEGYFVRTLGMHRVYNSAFMNMLRDERNAEYRQLIRNTLEYDPQILKRYVNFMSNPDERTAIDQFGADGKYFGVATLMATLPGLPMFGHGQIEGLAEKYGMEFRRPRWEEAPNEDLVHRHQRQLFPLLRRRGGFAEVDNFLLYDFVTGDGVVDENVFAFSNLAGGERSLVIFHNRFGDTRGRIRLSTSVAQRDGSGEKRLISRSLAEGLGLSDGEGAWVVFRDAVSGLEYLRSCRELSSEGIFVELDAYCLHVFLDFRDIEEGPDLPCRELAAHLGGRGVPEIEVALRRWALSPLLEPLRHLVDPSRLRGLAAEAEANEASAALLDEAGRAVRAFLGAAAERAGFTGDLGEIESTVLAELEAVVDLREQAEGLRGAADRTTSDAGENLLAILDEPETWGMLLSWILTRHLGGLAAGEERREQARSWFDEWFLGSTLADALAELGLPDETTGWAVAAVDLMVACENWAEPADGDAVDLHAFVKGLLGSPEGQRYLGAHCYEEELWYNQEAFEAMLRWLTIVAAAKELFGDATIAGAGIVAAHRLVNLLGEAGRGSGYRVAALIEALRKQEASPEGAE